MLPARAARRSLHRAAMGALLAGALAAGSAAGALSCGSEVSSHVAGGGGGTGGEAGAAGAGGGDAGSTCAYRACTRFPEADSFCVQYGAPPLGYTCTGMRTISAQCVYDYGGAIGICQNCLGWCCPPEPWEGPSYAELDAGPPVDAPAPTGCERQPADDFACLAQKKPPYAVYCPGLDIDNKPAGCFGNPYGDDSCGHPDKGYFCCPAP